MLLSGFTFIRNGIKYGYPFIQSIQSILPICDEMVVVVGDSDDGTRQAIEALDNPKIRIIDTVWDMTLREGGYLLAQQTNIALSHIKGRWGFYIQGDEVVHEADLPLILESVKKYDADSRVEGLLFSYTHFYGAYNYIATSRKWYRNEIRIVRAGTGVQSYKDAQGFRINNRKLNVKRSGGNIYHYGWVKPPRLQQLKQETFHKLWHTDQWMQQNIAQVEEFDYSTQDILVPFTGTHPAIMHETVSKQNWTFVYDSSKAKLSMRYQILAYIEKITGYRLFEYKNYRL